LAFVLKIPLDEASDSVFIRVLSKATNILSVLMVSSYITYETILPGLKIQLVDSHPMLVHRSKALCYMDDDTFHGRMHPPWKVNILYGGVPQSMDTMACCLPWKAEPSIRPW
jgi:hypothetical protein